MIAKGSAGLPRSSTGKVLKRVLRRNWRGADRSGGGRGTSRVRRVFECVVTIESNVGAEPAENEPAAPTA